MDETSAGTVTVDSFGLTDTGHKREANEDHFLVAEVRRAVDVRHTSLSSSALAHRVGNVAGHLFVVADGVGGRPEGDLASERTVTAVLEYVGRVTDCFNALDAAREHELLSDLEDAVISVHEGLLKEYGGATQRVPATTLSMVLLVWPRAYLVHVGDSRVYVRRRGAVQRLTRDQTFGEYMFSSGAWSAEQAARPGPAATLSSAIGGSEISPVVGLVDLEPGDSLLLCTDGLTKHVTDERITELLGGSGDATSVTRQLVGEALAGGGTDNVTVVVVRTDTP